MPERQPSPAQIRARAALMFRNRMRGLPQLPPLRRPGFDETPLSMDEVRFAYALGIAAPERQTIREGKAQ